MSLPPRSTGRYTVRDPPSRLGGPVGGVSLKKKKNRLGYLYQTMFNEDFRAHHALDDALALQRVIYECARRKGMPVAQLWVRDVPVDSIRGIGNATKQKLARKGIHTPEDLLAWVRNNEADVWREEMASLHRYMKLGKRLYGKRF